MRKLAPIALSAALATAGCNYLPFPGVDYSEVPHAVPGVSPPSVACPWVADEHYRQPRVLPNPGVPAVPPSVAKQFVAGCAIVRFTVGPDGHASTAALRAASPITVGPVALAALQQMRFQPARRPTATFVVRLGLMRDSAGVISVTPEVRSRVLHFWDLS